MTDLDEAQIDTIGRLARQLAGIAMQAAGDFAGADGRTAQASVALTLLGHAYAIAIVAVAGPGDLAPATEMGCRTLRQTIDAYAPLRGAGDGARAH